MSPEQLIRYKRHLNLAQVGVEGQQRLLDARVLVIGAGGLGSPAALYLAAAGIGTLGLIDFDRVDTSNLQRQVLFRTDEVGQSKVARAREHLQALNPDVRVEGHDCKLEASNAFELLSGWDVVIDGTDTFPSRYLASDVCSWLGVPLVYGSIMRFEGQVSVFDPKSEAPCYRCLFPEPPPPELAPSCAEAGVLGVLPGVVGTLQATEALKLVLGLGEPLRGRLLIYDALGMEFREFRIHRDPACCVCGDSPTITEPIDYVAFCASAAAAGAPVPEISPRELAARLAAGEDLLLLDVREPFESEIARIEGATLIPLGELERRLAELEAHRERPIVVHCHHGGRSRQACRLLRSQGFEKVENLATGIDGWACEVDSTLTRY
ncbi:MAG: molybdopterin-synthase adenylyltransferase MoeB [Myxococcota bacterium]